MLNPYSDEEWRKLLTHEIEARVRSFAWRHFEWVQTLPYGIDPDDLLQDAKLLVWTGKRTWYGERCSHQTVFPVLCATVRQLASKWRKKFEAERRSAAAHPKTELDYTPRRCDDGTSAELHLQKLLDLIREDDVLTQMIDYLLDHPDARERELANALGVERPVIYKANKRLGRKCKQLLEEIEQQQTSELI